MGWPLVWLGTFLGGRGQGQVNAAWGQQEAEGSPRGLETTRTLGGGTETESLVFPSPLALLQT